MNDTLEIINRDIQCAFPDKVIVPGEGEPDARIVLIGEAPGEKEAALRRPFVGKAGENLNEFLAISGIKRESVYITNAVKFRPAKTGKSGRDINRKPSADEIGAFRTFLLREIKVIKPKLVVTLGNVPLFALTGENIKIGDTHGKFIETPAFILYPMYHPASVIYNRSLKQTYIDDVKRLGERALNV